MWSNCNWPCWPRPNCKYGLWTNGLEFFFFERKDDPLLDVEFNPLGDWPQGDESVSLREVASFARLRRADPEMLRITFRRCHNFIHGNEGMPKDAAFWQFLYLIFAKMHDEKRSRSALPQLLGRPDEQFDEAGRKRIRERILPLFDRGQEQYASIFRGNEEITLSDRALAFMVSSWPSTTWGAPTWMPRAWPTRRSSATTCAATAASIFTPRGAVRWPSPSSTPSPDERFLDPACGPGGFIVATIDHQNRRFHAEAKLRIGAESTEEFLSIQERLADYAPHQSLRRRLRPVPRARGADERGDGGPTPRRSSFTWIRWSSRAAISAAWKGKEGDPAGHDRRAGHQPALWLRHPHHRPGTSWSSTSWPHLGAHARGRLPQHGPAQGQRGARGALHRALHPVAQAGRAAWASCCPTASWAIPATSTSAGGFCATAGCWRASTCRWRPSSSRPTSTSSPACSSSRRRPRQEIAAIDLGGEPDYPVFMAVAEKVGFDRRGNTLYKRGPDGEEIIEEREVIERSPSGYQRKCKTGYTVERSPAPQDLARCWTIDLPAQLPTSDRLSYLQLRKGMTLISCSGTIGRMTYARPDMDGIWSSQDVMKVVADESKIPSGYLYAFLASRYGVPLVITRTYGAIIPHLESHQIADLPVPRFSEEIESLVHYKVDSAAKKRSYASELMTMAQVELFLQLNMPDPSPDSRFGSPKIAEVSASRLQRRCDAFHFSAPNAEARAAFDGNAFDKRPLHEVADVFIPGIFKRRYALEPEFGYPYITGADVFELAPTTDQYLMRSVAETYDLVIREGMILVQEAGQLGGLIGRSVMVGRYLDGFACTNNMIRITPRNDEDTGYIFAVLASDYGVRLIAREAAGSSIPHIEASRIQNLTIPWPDRDTRLQIGASAIEARNLRDSACDLEQQAREIVEQAIEGAA
jgi:type I restriction enzyme S subunit